MIENIERMLEPEPLFFTEAQLKFLDDMHKHVVIRRLVYSTPSTVASSVFRDLYRRAAKDAVVLVPVPVLPLTVFLASLYVEKK